MSIDDWHVVSRKKHGYRSYEDDVAKISISIYVSNLPETFSAKDLFHACNKYGYVVDSFIPLKRSKEGKRFGFVKFINVSNVERLVGNLCTVWVGRYKLQTNKARFGRPPLNGRNIRNSKSDDRHLGGFKEPNVRPTNGNKETRNNSFASVLKSNQPNNLSSSNMIHDSSPAIALDDDCLSANDLSCVAIGKIKDINALSNLSVILNDEGFDDIKISYLGGYWVLIQSKSCASKEKLINHAGVLNWFHELGNANNSFVSDIRLVWIAIEGLPMCAWNNKALSKIVSPWGVEEEQLHHLVKLVGSISLSPSNDRWAWLLGSSGEFSVHSARTFIGDILLPFVGDVTRWVKVVPIKVNILAWKVCLDKLPTRLNLSLRGIDIPSIICPNCGLAGESCSHLFYSCNLARTLWRKIARWWEIDIPDFSCYEEWIAWFKTTRFSKAQKEMLEGVFYVMWWMIWKFRNQVLFGSSHPRMELLFDDIVSYSFTWCSNRCKNNIDWISWMKCPKSISL
ncbi:RNA-directed DNA polymerase, eukaryota [Tanacetum coccineum]